MKPIVIISTHNRRFITDINIQLLQPQAQVVLVVSNEFEEYYYKHRYPDIVVLFANNSPLGAKWQYAVSHARNLDHTHFIINGSDDLLSKDFIEKAISANVDMYGLKSWFITDGDQLFLFDYMPKQPLGGGRCYSRDFLERIQYQLFDNSKEKLLDDKGFEMSNGFNVRLVNEPDILAVKGPWETMNPLQITLKHRNAKLKNNWSGHEAKKIMIEKFGFYGF